MLLKIGLKQGGCFSDHIRTSMTSLNDFPATFRNHEVFWVGSIMTPGKAEEVPWKGTGVFHTFYLFSGLVGKLLTSISWPYLKLSLDPKSALERPSAEEKNCFCFLSFVCPNCVSCLFLLCYIVFSSSSSFLTLAELFVFSGFLPGYPPWLWNLQDKATTNQPQVTKQPETPR